MHMYITFTVHFVKMCQKPRHPSLHSELQCLNVFLLRLASTFVARDVYKNTQLRSAILPTFRNNLPVLPSRVTSSRKTNAA